MLRASTSHQQVAPQVPPGLFPVLRSRSAAAAAMRADSDMSGDTEARLWWWWWWWGWVCCCSSESFTSSPEIMSSTKWWWWFSFASLPTAAAIVEGLPRELMELLLHWWLLLLFFWWWLGSTSPFTRPTLFGDELGLVFVTIAATAPDGDEDPPRPATALISPSALPPLLPQVLTLHGDDPLTAAAREADCSFFNCSSCLYIPT